MTRDAATAIPAARRIADFAAGLDAATLPAAVREAARLHLLDALGVGMAAASLAIRPRIEDAVALLGCGGRSTGLGASAPMPAPAAALLNGSLIHALEFDDTHMAAVVHASAVVAPAALAMAEHVGASGAELLAAYVLGFEVMTRAGLAGPSVFQTRGFQSTAVLGAPAAALVAARLAGSGADGMVHAMGVAGSQAGGIFEFLTMGGTVKMIHGGWPAHAGVMAAALAGSGLTGPATVLDGERGLYRAFAAAPEAAIRLARELDDLGTRWRVTEAAFKPWPCCHYLQSSIECLRDILASGIAARDVTRLECELPAEVAWLVCEPWAEKLAPASGHVAKFSLPYCLAAVLTDGDVSVDTFDRSAPDPRLAAAMATTSWRPMADSGFPSRYPARLHVTTRDGGVHTAEVMDVLGSPTRPMTATEVRAKFRRNAARLLDDRGVEAVLSAVDCLDRAPDLGALSDALRSAGAQPRKAAS
ncbi:MAG: MmgE/PrpD family protein [Ectothiorhodospiraceae bacterium]|nr:MmgE/PrpD family protein [Chromatiales bacterium]MCP5155511.1 MmgE/PrpD family protein [Ectothiorhodospiraceae bacterium]